jgi:hypothetical protein
LRPAGRTGGRWTRGVYHHVNCPPFRPRLAIQRSGRDSPGICGNVTHASVSAPRSDNREWTRIDANDGPEIPGRFCSRTSEPQDASSLPHPLFSSIDSPAQHSPARRFDGMPDRVRPYAKCRQYKKWQGNGGAGEWSKPRRIEPHPARPSIGSVLHRSRAEDNPRPMADRKPDRMPSVSPPHRPPPSVLLPSVFRLTASPQTVSPPHRPLGSVDWTSARPRFASCEIRLDLFCTGVEPRKIRVPGCGAFLVLLNRFPCPTFPCPPI